MLPGVQTREINRRVDDRGYFAELLRSDWNDLLAGDSVAQVNLSMSYPGMIRAWHRHARGQVDYFAVLRGALKICAYDDAPGSPTRGQLDELVVGGDHPAVARIPGHYWHGTMAVGNEPALTVYLVSKLYDYEHPDEERRPWNDPTIVDPRTQAAFDWNRPPHK
jgi:dTDP-4-dehydrorhamnose 3,5-epimerase